VGSGLAFGVLGFTTSAPTMLALIGTSATLNKLNKLNEIENQKLRDGKLDFVSNAYNLSIKDVESRGNYETASDDEEPIVDGGDLPSQYNFELEARKAFQVLQNDNPWKTTLRSCYESFDTQLALSKLTNQDMASEEDKAFTVMELEEPKEQIKP
jgi:hypothetical protein